MWQIDVRILFGLLLIAFMSGIALTLIIDVWLDKRGKERV